MKAVVEVAADFYYKGGSTAGGVHAAGIAGVSHGH
jgi:hypothetical protein